MSQSGKVAIIVDDMFFASKVTSAAEAAGRKVERLRSREQIENLTPPDLPQLVIIDLNSDRINPIEAIELLKSQRELESIPIVAFVSHVQIELIRRAQAAGCDFVLPRSAFTQMLAQIVAGDLSSLRRNQARG